MKEIIEHFGSAVVAFAAVIALVALVTVLIGTDATSVVGQAFNALIGRLTSI